MNRKLPWIFDLMVALVSIATITWLLLACGCSPVRHAAVAIVKHDLPAAPANTPLHPAGETSAEKRLAEMQDALAQTEAREGELRARIKVQSQIVHDEAWKWLHTLNQYLCGLALVVAMLSAAAAIYFRCARLAMVTLCAVGMVVVGLGTDWVLFHPLRAAIGLGAVFAVAALLIWARAHSAAVKKTENRLLDQARTVTAKAETDAAIIANTKK